MCELYRKKYTSQQSFKGICKNPEQKQSNKRFKYHFIVTISVIFMDLNVIKETNEGTTIQIGPVVLQYDNRGRTKTISNLNDLAKIETYKYQGTEPLEKLSEEIYSNRTKLPKQWSVEEALAIMDSEPNSPLKPASNVMEGILKYTIKTYLQK